MERINGVIARALALALMALSLPAVADEGWRDANGNAIADTPSAKSMQGFAAMLVVTPDKDWEKKWNTPPEVAPHFSEASEVSDGGALHILAFLSNPMLDPAGTASVTCDFRLTRPDGSRAIDESQLPCFAGKLETNLKHIYLTSISVTFIEEPSEPRGQWKVDVTVRDMVRGVAIPLEAGFEVK